jgi:3-dehydroquinate synthase
LANGFELHDRQFSLAGLAACAAAKYRTTNGVSSGYFGRNPCFTLSSANDIRYPVIRSSNVFDPSNLLLKELTGQGEIRKKLLIVVDKFYDDLKHHEITERINRYFHHHGGLIEAISSAPTPSFRSVDVIVRRLNPVKGFSLGAAQENKTPEQVDQVVSWCQEYKLPRDGMLIAVGGGVTLDIVGFAAQQYRRMVSYIRIPTTLIGQVDAGVGVKVGVNYGSSKNLIGAFYPPYATINDPQFLCDLEPRQIECGLAEIIKMGVIADADIIVMLERLHREDLRELHEGLTGELLREKSEILDHLVEISDNAILSMMRELQMNITEHELKRLVDFGHTFSPKIESLSDYRIPHGYAVAMDMYLSCFIAYQIAGRFREHRLIDSTLFDRYRRLLRDYRLLIAPYLDQTPLLTDRKTDLFNGAVDDCIRHRGGNLNLVVPVSTVGRGGFVNLSPYPHQQGSGFSAVIPRKDLYDLFGMALEALNECGTRMSF